ncbi:MAG: PDR/VanB family oxidoreductase [Alphaproteobacteria bacterium]|nr:PDR/VanB family oxidoreductase [Alphaproteobacteria bacterium]
MSPTPFPAILKSVDVLSDEVKSFTFEALQGTPFTNAQPGGHIDVLLPNELLRQYSLWRWAEDGRSGSVAVKREEAGRGGSQAMHDLKIGTEVTLNGPRNNFPLKEDAPHSILLAGGIGATPIYAMAARLTALGRPVQVHYLIRSRAHAAFQNAFESLGLGNALSCHYDDTHGLMDLGGMLDAAPAGSHLYVCGPEPLLQAVLNAAASRLPEDQIHFERFAADPSALEGPLDSFEIVLAKSGRTLRIPANRSILEGLQDAGIRVDFGCMEGVCGACIVDVLEGEIDHCDSVLTSDEQADNTLICVCVSRAKGKSLTLDL